MDILNDILAAVSNGINSLYPNLDIFSEFVPDDLPDTCFMIGFAGEPEIKKELGKRYKASGKIDITYYVPKHSPTLNAEFNRVFLNLSLNLQRVTFNETTISLFSHTHKVDDDILHDICSFSTYIYANDNTPFINRMEAGYVGNKK